MSMIRSAGVSLFILAVFCGAAGPAQADKVRLERLNIMFEGNESGAAFVRHCMKGKPTKASAGFMNNTILTNESLLREMQAEFPALSNNQALEALAKKQDSMKGPLDSFYSKQGCKTKQAQAAFKHFKMFNEKPQEDMQAFLDNIENE